MSRAFSCSFTNSESTTKVADSHGERPPYRKPEELLDELGVETPQEIDVDAIAYYCGAPVVYAPLAGCEARLLGHGDRAIITVSSRAACARQRFSIAHELGHWLSDRGRVSFGCTKQDFVRGWSQSNGERRANRFAADLLLPTPLFEPRARGRPILLETASDIARLFETSLTATTIRLVELGSFPSMVLYSEEGGRRWFIRSRDLPSSFWPSEVPGDGSVAADLIRGNVGTQAPVEVGSIEWTDREGAERVPVMEDSRRIGDGVLTLLWWKDEELLARLIEDEEQ